MVRSSERSAKRAPISGGCLCGAVRYEVTAEPHDAGYCHCGMCRRATGAPVAAFIMVPSNALRFTRGQPAIYQSSHLAERSFCPACGSALTYRRLSTDDIAVTAGSLDDPDAFPPRAHYEIGSAVGWLTIADDLPHWDCVATV